MILALRGEEEPRRVFSHHMTRLFFCSLFARNSFLFYFEEESIHRIQDVQREDRQNKNLCSVTTVNLTIANLKVVVLSPIIKDITDPIKKRHIRIKKFNLGGDS